MYAKIPNWHTWDNHLYVQMYKYTYTTSFSLNDSSDIMNYYSDQGAYVIAISRFDMSGSHAHWVDP